MLFASVVPYTGTAFWSVVAFTVFSHRIAQSLRGSVAVRNVVMIAVSLVTVASVMGNAYMAAILILLSTLVYVSGSALLALDARNRRLALSIFSIIVVSCLLCFYKYAVIQAATIRFWHLLTTGIPTPSPEHKHIFFIGISYFTFKFIHFLSDCYNRKIKAINYLSFVNYTLFFPSFFSGPINRYSNFHEDIQAGAPCRIISKNSIESIRRVVTGLFKKIVLANNLLPYTIISLDPSDPSTSSLQVILGIYAYMFYIYFDFAGYTDMAIGCGKLIGINLPENFNSPFLKRNLQQFWANWHMSLTSWLTDYIYWPLARKTRRIAALRKKPVTVSNICIVITFVVCGLWHGDGFNFFLWGLYHGIGLAILNGYTSLEKKHFPLRWRKAINNSSHGYFISMLITFQYVAFGFFLFACDFKSQRAFFDIIL